MMGARIGIVSLVVALGLFAAPSPAAADNDTCAGVTGTMVTSSPLYYPGMSGPTTASFNITFNTARCLSGGIPPTLTGTLTGWCGEATGVGESSGGHDFGVLWFPIAIAFSGETSSELFLGYVIVEADRFAGQSCITGANRFLITYGATTSWH